MSATCRFCSTELRETFVDLGMSPLCQSHVPPEKLGSMEPFFPLQVWICHECLLVQLEEIVAPDDIFGTGDYAYFSSYSESWLAHARDYSEQMLERFGLGPDQRVVEIASNDGYLLQWFHKKGIPVLGIEPAANCAAAAREKGVESVVAFFGRETAERVLEEHGAANLLLGNNVLAHVPDINDFVGGMKVLLAPDGVVTMEFPHLLRLMRENQFDTIYHEHYTYLSFGTVEKIFAHHGLLLFDVEELPTHGGSLRIYARHAENSALPVGERVGALHAREREAGMDRLEGYAGFAEQVHETKRKLLEFLIAARREGKRVAGYGAPGKGNTLLNYCGVRTDFLDYTVDRSPHKQGNFLPGTRIPILPPEKVFETKPDYLLILPWNLRSEIMEQMAGIREWGGRFVVPIPETRVFE
ncbi:MAG: methyltransferase domain-containing protein [Myxococcota bacterium]